MTRRNSIAIVAAGLVLLTTLVSARWAASNGWQRARGQQPSSTGVRKITPEPTATAPTQRLPPATPRPPTPRLTGLPAGLRRTTGLKAVAVTFDDGPHPVWTPKVLDQLRKAGVKATFCLLGTEAQRFPALVARIVREGHTLCNHSWHHELNLGALPETEIRANLERTNRAIKRAVPGARIRYFRQPGGKWTALEVKVVRDLGMVPLHWSVDPADWQKPGATVIIQRIADRVRAGSIVLLHDGGGDRSGTLGACPTVLTTLKRQYGVVALK
jgi:peptidoglycan-N-acetylglucosamine deacetylase